MFESWIVKFRTTVLFAFVSLGVVEDSGAVGSLEVVITKVRTCIVIILTAFIDEKIKTITYNIVVLYAYKMVVSI